MGNDKDILEKTLESFDDVLADIVNGLIFGGRKVVREADLEQAKLRSYYEGERGIREMERDAGKYWNGAGFRLACFCLENESGEEEDMPLRMIGYDGASYRDQLFYEAGENGKRVRNRNPRYPVITLVLYFGTERHWKAPRTLLENLQDFPEELRPYVNDYEVNVFEIAWLTDEQVKLFTSDFRIVADYFVQVRKTGEYAPPNIEVIHMRELLHLMSVLTKDDRFEKAYRECKKKKEKPRKMCEVLDKIENRGMQKGIQQTLTKNLVCIMATLHLTLEQAMDCLEVKEEERANLERLIREQTEALGCEKTIHGL